MPGTVYHAVSACLTLAQWQLNHILAKITFRLTRIFTCLYRPICCVRQRQHHADLRYSSPQPWQRGKACRCLTAAFAGIQSRQNTRLNVAITSSALKTSSSKGRRRRTSIPLQSDNGIDASHTQLYRRYPRQSRPVRVGSAEGVSANFNARSICRRWSRLCDGDTGTIARHRRASALPARTAVTPSVRSDWDDKIGSIQQV